MVRCGAEFALCGEGDLLVSDMTRDLCVYLNEGVSFLFVRNQKLFVIVHHRLIVSVLIVGRSFPLFQNLGDPSEACWAIQCRSHKLAELFSGESSLNLGGALLCFDLARSAVRVVRSDLLSSSLAVADGFLQVRTEGPRPGARSRASRKMLLGRVLDGLRRMVGWSPSGVWQPP